MPVFVRHSGAGGNSSSFMSLPKLDDVSALLKAHLDAEALAGFPRLTRTPSSGTIQFLDHFDTLAAADRDSLLAAHAEINALKFFPALGLRERVEELVTTNPALVRYRQAMQSAPFTMGMRYVGLRMLNSMLGDPVSREMMARTRATLDFIPRDDLPAALVPDPEPAHLKPAKAPLLRKLINEAFPEFFATGKQKREGGETEYVGALAGTNIKVIIDFSARGPQLRYGVKIPDETKKIFVWGLAYEDLWAASTGWDYLTEENAEPSIRLLCENIAQIVLLRNRVFDMLQRSL
jgi:hypothetical protein